MKHNYKENDIIIYPVPGVVFNKPDKKCYYDRKHICQ